MSYQRIGSLMMRAYPPAFRSARGEEVLGALLDAADDSFAAFVKGCASLVIGGLRERAFANAKLGARRLIIDAFCQAAVLWTLYTLVAKSHQDLPVWPAWTLVLLAAVPVLALLGRDRLGGLCGLVVAGHFLIGSGTRPSPGPELLGYPGLVGFIDRWLAATVCLAVMVLKPRVRSHDPRKLVWLVPIVLLFLIPGPAALVLLLIGLPLLGIFQLPVDPRLAIASAVLWVDVAAALTLGQIRWGLVTFPVLLLAVLIAVVRTRAFTNRASV